MHKKIKKNQSDIQEKNHWITGSWPGTGTYISNVGRLKKILVPSPPPNLGQWCNRITADWTIELVEKVSLDQ